MEPQVEAGEPPYHGCMSKALRATMLLTTALGALVGGFSVVAYDIPVMSGRLIMDAYDPVLKRSSAVLVSPWALAAHLALVASCVVLFVWLWRKGRKSNGSKA
jgi:hypothetical protein